jgi:hypothetical protein
LAISAVGATVPLRLYVKLAPLWQRMTASVAVRMITGRPRNSQISPVSSRRDNRE